MKKIYLFALLLVLLLGYCSFAVIDTAPRPMSVYYLVEVDSGTPDLGATIFCIQYDPSTRAVVEGTRSTQTYYANGKKTFRLAAGKNWRIYVVLANAAMHMEPPTGYADIPNLNSSKSVKFEWAATNTIR